MAVGSSATGSGTEKPLTERWNGSAWSIQASPEPGDAKGFVNLTDVSCLSPSSCFAGGYYAPGVAGGVFPTSLKTLTQSWNGSAWSVQSSPNPNTYSTLAGISCSASIACTGVGASASVPTGETPRPVVVRYE